MSTVDIDGVPIPIDEYNEAMSAQQKYDNREYHPRNDNHHSVSSDDDEPTPMAKPEPTPEAIKLAVIEQRRIARNKQLLYWGLGSLGGLFIGVLALFVILRMIRKSRASKTGDMEQAVVTVTADEQIAAVANAGSSARGGAGAAGEKGVRVTEKGDALEQPQPPPQSHDQARQQPQVFGTLGPRHKN